MAAVHAAIPVRPKITCLTGTDACSLTTSGLDLLSTRPRLGDSHLQRLRFWLPSVAAGQDAHQAGESHKCG
jgi:hypothetical protein